MRVREDAIGLRYEIDPPDTSAGRDLVELIRRGDVRGSSFGFEVRRDNVRRDKIGPLRELLDVRLIDVSPVVTPAYPATTAKLWGDAAADLRAWIESRKIPAANAGVANWTAPPPQLPKGLGTRHAATATITASTDAVGIVVSQSTGTVTVFKAGQMITDIHKLANGKRLTF